MPNNAPRLRVVTFNLRFATAPDGPDAWEFRRDAALARLAELDPDVLGVQEALATQMDALRVALPNHDALGVGRNDGVREGEFCGLFYRRELLAPRESGVRWISDQPTLPGSMGPGARIPRVFTWGDFTLRGGARALVVVTHLDNDSAEARLLGARQIATFLAERPGAPAVVMGDLNCEIQDEPLATLLGHGLVAARPPTGPLGTFQNFDPDLVDGPAIDHVLVSPGWPIASVQIDRARRTDGRVLSDHFPLVVDLAPSAGPAR